jgi:deoxyribonuclease-4
VRLGFHVSIAGGFGRVRERALEVGCETLQVFVSNPQGWQAAPLVPEDVGRFRSDIAESELGPVFCHVPYLPNPAAPPGPMRARSIKSLRTQLARCAALGIDRVVCHVGKGLGADESTALARVTETVNRVLDDDGSSATLLLENTAGMGTEVGWQFAQIASVIERVERKERVGVMLDTAHAFEAGYEFRTRTGLDLTLREFDRTVGLARLHGLHLNDSKTEFGSRVDRHWHIGEGCIGLEGFRLIVNHPLLRGLPAVLETPRGSADDDRRNMKTVRGLIR